jgi:hypothetical protein
VHPEQIVRSQNPQVLLLVFEYLLADYNPAHVNNNPDQLFPVQKANQ